METRAEWLEKRRKYIGGSDVAAIMGESPFKTATDVYMEKVGLSAGSEETVGMSTGRKIEPILLEIYTERTGNAVQSFPTLFNEKFPWLGANVDGIVFGKPIVVEAKATSPFQRRGDDKWGEDGTDQVPNGYNLQAQTYMIVSGHRVVHMPVFFDIHTQKIFIIEFHEGLADAILSETKAFFYNHVKKEIPPPIKGDDASKRLLTAMYPMAVDKVMNADEQIDALVAARRDCLAVVNFHEKEILGYDNSIKALMGDHSKVIGSDYTITWSNVSGGKSLDYERLMLDLGVTAEMRLKYETTGKPRRRFQVKATGQICG